MQNYLKEKIAISGFGCCCGAGNDLPSTWHSLDNAQVNAVIDPGHYFEPGRPAPLFLVSKENLADDVAAFLQQSSSLPQIKKLNRTILLTLTGVIETLKTADFPLEYLQTKRIGVALGTTVGCTFNNEDYYIDWKNDDDPDSAVVDRYLQANLAEAIQRLLGIRGPRAVITNACASGTDAIGVGKMWLESNACDLVLAGGADELSRIGCRGFHSLMLVSNTPCRPFDHERDGLTLGEGAGLLLMEKESHLRKRKGPLHGWVRGYGASCDAYHPTAPHPDGRGLQQAIRNCITDGCVELGDIALINGHGTGTRANDIAETTALHHLGFNSLNAKIISTKGATGHTLGAAGGIEAVLTLVSLNKGYTVGSIGCRTQDPSLPITILAENNTSRLQGNIGMSQSLAFGGSNGVVLLEGNPS